MRRTVKADAAGVADYRSKGGIEIQRTIGQSAATFQVAAAETTPLSRFLSSTLAAAVLLTACFLALDNMVSLEQLLLVPLGLRVGYQGRQPVLPGQVSRDTVEIPPTVQRPPWGDPTGGAHAGAEARQGHWERQPQIQGQQGLAAMRAAGHLAAQALALAGQLAIPGTTTEALNQAVHRFIVEHGGYPSPLGYAGFPKSICTSVNEVVVHGIPDSRPLQEGDIVNVDVTVYLGGVHADTSATFAMGQVNDKASALLSATREALEAAVRACGPGVPVRRLGQAVQAVADARGMPTVALFVGHGIGSAFHASPTVHGFYPKWWQLERWAALLLNPSTSTVLVPGMTFTIEPILVEPGGSTRTRQWTDGWTHATSDGSLSAQFEYTLAVRSQEEGGGCEVLTPALWDQQQGQRQLEHQHQQ